MRWPDSGFNTEDCSLTGSHCLGTSRQTIELQENHAMELTLGRWFWTSNSWKRIGWDSPHWLAVRIFFHSFLIDSVFPPTWKDVNSRKLLFTWYSLTGLRYKISNSSRNSSRSAKSWSELEVRFWISRECLKPN